MPNFNSIGSGVSELQVAENRYLPLTGGIALTTVYALTCYTVIQDTRGCILGYTGVQRCKNPEFTYLHIEPIYRKGGGGVAAEKKKKRERTGTGIVIKTLM